MYLTSQFFVSMSCSNKNKQIIKRLKNIIGKTNQAVSPNVPGVLDMFREDKTGLSITSKLPICFANEIKIKAKHLEICLLMFLTNSTIIINLDIISPFFVLSSTIYFVHLDFIKRGTENLNCEAIKQIKNHLTNETLSLSIISRQYTIFL